MITINTYHLIFDKSNMMGANSGAETAFPSEHMSSNPQSPSPDCFCGAHVAQSLDCYVVFCRSLFAFGLFFCCLYLLAYLSIGHVSFCHG